MMTNFDFVVVGGGSAGYAAARTASNLGLRTAVVEGGEKVGGLCILRGCMPSKTLIESANRFRTLREASKFGLKAEHISFDSALVLQRKKELIEEFASHRQSQLEEGKFEFVRGTAEFLDPWNIRIELLSGGTVSIRARSFLISTGSTINLPAIAGLELPGILTSDSLLESAEVPDSVLVLGSGPVGLEAAHYYESFGSKVTIIQRSNHLLSGSDLDVADSLRAAFEERGMQIYTDTHLRKIEKDGSLYSVTFEHKESTRTIHASKVVNALGRKPNIQSLELDRAGVALEGRAIKTSTSQQSSTPHIFAAGDVCGPYEIVHIAIHQGEVAARNAARLLSGNEQPFEEMDYRLKVFAVFTEPQIAMAGASEEDLKTSGISFLTASHPFSDHGKSMVRGETAGFVKLLAHRETGEILGGSVIGPEASELIHEIVVAIRYRSTVREFALIPHYHPTLSEIWTYPAEELAEICGKRSIEFPDQNLHLPTIP